MSDEIMYRNPVVRKHIVGGGAIMGYQEIGSTLFEAGKNISMTAQKKLRDVSKERLQQCIGDMLLLRAQDGESAGFLRRMLTY